jgi:hypothetical protein
VEVEMENRQHCNCGGSAERNRLEEAEADWTEGKPLNPDMRVGEVIARWPGAADAMVAGGLVGLSDPLHRERIRTVPVSVRMACRRHGLDLEAMMALLSKAAGNPPG